MTCSPRHILLSCALALFFVGLAVNANAAEEGITDRPTAQRDLPTGAQRANAMDEDSDGDGIDDLSDAQAEALDDDDDGDGVPTASGMKAKEKANKSSCSVGSGDCDDGDPRATPGADAQNHNSSRSNRTQPAMLDPDDDGDGVETAEEPAGAQNHNSSRSNRTQPSAVDAKEEDSNGDQAGQNPAQRMMQNRPPRPAPTTAPKPPKPPVSDGMMR